MYEKISLVLEQRLLITPSELYVPGKGYFLQYHPAGGNAESCFW